MYVCVILVVVSTFRRPEIRMLALKNYCETAGLTIDRVPDSKYVSQMNVGIQVVRVHLGINLTVVSCR
jgi:hypothetical protein